MKFEILENGNWTTDVAISFHSSLCNFIWWLFQNFISWLFQNSCGDFSGSGSSHSMHKYLSRTRIWDEIKLILTLFVSLSLSLSNGTVFIHFGLELPYQMCSNNILYNHANSKLHNPETEMALVWNNFIVPAYVTQSPEHLLLFFFFVILENYKFPTFSNITWCFMILILTAAHPDPWKKE